LTFTNKSTFLGESRESSNSTDALLTAWKVGGWDATKETRSNEIECIWKRWIEKNDRKQMGKNNQVLLHNSCLFPDPAVIVQIKAKIIERFKK